MRIQEASGVDLDWITARKLDPTVSVAQFNKKRYAKEPGYRYTENGQFVIDIVELDRIRLDCPWENSFKAQAYYTAKVDGWTGWVVGKSAMEAALRCYALKGVEDDEVEIPKTLRRK